jgi:putative sporulation protein YyaC
MNLNNSAPQKKSYNLIYALSNYLCEEAQKPIILCLGSEKVIADSLGPLVGHLLVTKYNINTIVYGKLGRAVNANNVEAYYKHIKKTHPNQKILTIDASMGSLQDYGTVQIKKGGIVTMANKLATPIGDISITGIVLPKGCHYKMLLQKTKLHFVYELACQIANAVYHAYQMMY